MSNFEFRIARKTTNLRKKRQYANFIGTKSRSIIIFDYHILYNN